MNGSTDVCQQVEGALNATGAFDATCPSCGKLYAFHSTPRLRDYLTLEPGGPREVTVLLPCTRCRYLAAHVIEVGAPGLDVPRAA